MSEKLNYNPNDFVCNIPIEERLKNVPEDAEWWVHQWSTSDHFEIGRICLEAYNKLNEQQAEIEFLKKEILEKHEDWKHEGQQAANARAEIKALKKKKEHWENQYIIENKKWKFAEKSFSDLLMRTVNTTNPAKDLTNAEILWLADEYSDEENLVADCVGFARAVLRKAKE